MCRQMPVVTGAIGACSMEWAPQTRRPAESEWKRKAWVYNTRISKSGPYWVGGVHQDRGVGTAPGRYRPHCVSLPCREMHAETA